MKCLVCRAEGAEELCAHHREAKEALVDAYPQWARAYGGMDWKVFLDNVKRNPQTGQWARETAEILEAM